MNKLIVTIDANGVIEIDFGLYYTAGVIPFKKAYYSKDYIVKAHLLEEHILVWGSDMRTFDVVELGNTSGKGLEVESINGTTPTSLEHLFELIKAII